MAEWGRHARQEGLVLETPDTVSLSEYAEKHLFADTHVKSPRTSD